MVTPKPPANTYSTWLRQRRQARPRVIAPTDVLQIGGWLIADDDGDLVIVNRASGARTVLVRNEEVI